MQTERERARPEIPSFSKALGLLPEVEVRGGERTWAVSLDSAVYIYGDRGMRPNRPGGYVGCRSTSTLPGRAPDPPAA